MELSPQRNISRVQESTHISIHNYPGYPAKIELGPHQNNATDHLEGNLNGREVRRAVQRNPNCCNRTLKCVETTTLCALLPLIVGGVMAFSCSFRICTPGYKVAAYIAAFSGVGIGICGNAILKCAREDFF